MRDALIHGHPLDGLAFLDFGVRIGEHELAVLVLDDRDRFHIVGRRRGQARQHETGCRQAGNRSQKQQLATHSNLLVRRPSEGGLSSFVTAPACSLRNIAAVCTLMPAALSG